MVFSVLIVLLGSAPFVQFQVPQQQIQPAGQQNVQSTKPAVNNPSTTPAPNDVAPVEKTSAPPKVKRKQLKISAQQPWTDTGIDLLVGDKVTVNSQGTLKYMEDSNVGPQGTARTLRDALRALPVNDAGRGALIARISNSQAAVPFLIGDSKTFEATHSGRLFLGINEASDEAGSGYFSVSVKIVPARAVANAVTTAKPLIIPADIFGKIPRRVTDAQGNKGDMVNFVIIGPEDKMKNAFEQAGWVQVDKTKQDAVLHAVVSTLSNKTYTAMPMSELMLFGRSQDYGFARAEPVQVVESRNHLRVWKAPFDFEGQTVWVGAATHDIGFEKDNRNGSITHKIDPNVDLERDFVGSTLGETGLIAASTYVLPKDPIQTAFTATGGSFHSDGRVLMMQLK
ncbi:MAG TPA: LssY C-terminal domain-containing protein [Terriglobales bacterium]|nr:LssY C-terminal domain-containing protein [Terriglobales bacterium]